MHFSLYLNFIIPVVTKMFIPDGRYGSLTIITDTIILPATLALLNIAFVIKNPEISYVKYFSFMLIGLLLGDSIGYLIWGISSKNLLKPDAETLWITRSLLLYHVAAVVVVFFLLLISRSLIQYFLKFWRKA